MLRSFTISHEIGLLMSNATVLGSCISPYPSGSRQPYARSTPTWPPSGCAQPLNRTPLHKHVPVHCSARCALVACDAGVGDPSAFAPRIDHARIRSRTVSEAPLLAHRTPD